MSWWSPMVFGAEDPVVQQGKSVQLELSKLDGVESSDQLLSADEVEVSSQSEQSEQSDVTSVPTWFLSRRDASQKWAIIPSPSRNDTYGYMGSLRGFIYPTRPIGYYTAVSVTGSENGFWSVDGSYQSWKENGDQWDFYVLYDGFSDPYYGEGHFTKVDDFQYLSSNKVSVHLQYLFNLGWFLYGGAFTGFQYREEDSLQPKFPTEHALLVGLLLYYDSRNDLFDPTEGEYYSVRSWLLAQTRTPLFLDGSIQLFFPVLSRVVLAQHGKMGLTLLEPSSYLFRFKLGGTQTLRGFRFNRFRGENYYLSQTEVRVSLFRFLTLAVFCDLGSADDNVFTLSPHISYGGGVRLGLPPNYNQKIRIEWGFGEDQTNWMIAFAHPF